MRIPARLLLIGSLLCAGIACADDELDLNSAIADLNGMSRLPHARWSIYAVIGLQTDVLVGKLMADRTVNRLGYGELLVAESLATATGKPLPELVAQKQKSQSWTQVAKLNGINPGSLTGRLRAATASMHIAERSYNQQQQQRMNMNLKHSPPSGVKAPTQAPQRYSSTTWRQPMSPMRVRPPTGPRKP